MRRFAPVLVILVVAVLVILGLNLLRGRASRDNPSNGAGQTGAIGPKIVVLSPNNMAIQREFGRAFEAWHKKTYGAEVVVEYQDRGGTSDDVKFIKSEFGVSPGGIGIDLFWGGGAEPYMQFKELGLLQRVELPKTLLDALPPQVGGVPVYDAQGLWYGTALSSFGIIHNRKRLADLGLPEPKTWEDLGRPEYAGEVAAANPASSGSALAMVEVILQAYGWEKGTEALVRSAANVQTFSAGANDVPKLVSAGQCAAGTVIDFYAWTQIQIDGKDKIGFVLPEGLTPITPDGIGLLKGAPNPVAAKRFIEFVLSEEGQALWTLPKGAPGGPVESELLRMPVLPEVYKRYADVTNVMFDPSQVKAGFAYDPGKAAARREALKDLYKTALIDLAPELREAWRAVIKRGMKPEELRALCKPLLGEEELAACSAKWNDVLFRNEKITEWAGAARARYEGLAGGR